MIPYRASLRSDLASRGLSEPPDSLPRGTGGRIAPDQLDDLDRNRWTNWAGTSGRFPPDQVDDFIGIRKNWLTPLYERMHEHLLGACASNI